MYVKTDYLCIGVSIINIEINKRKYVKLNKTRRNKIDKNRKIKVIKQSNKSNIEVKNEIKKLRSLKNWKKRKNH